MTDFSKNSIVMDATFNPAIPEKSTQCKIFLDKSDNILKRLNYDGTIVPLTQEQTIKYYETKVEVEADQSTFTFSVPNPNKIVKELEVALRNLISSTQENLLDNISQVAGALESYKESQNLANGIVDTDIRDIENKISEIETLVNTKVSSSDFTELQEQLAKFVKNINDTLVTKVTKKEIEEVKNSIPAPVSIVSKSENVTISKEGNVYGIAVDVPEITKEIRHEIEVRGGGISKATVQKMIDSAVEDISGGGGGGGAGFVPLSGDGIEIIKIGEDYEFSVLDYISKSETNDISAGLVSYSQATSANALAQAITYTNLLDTNVVHKTGDESISGNKTFFGSISTSGSFIDLDPNYTPAWREARLFYDSEFKTLSYYNDNSDITVNVGQEQIIRVRNNTGATILNGKVVCISGSNGSHPLIVLASNTSPSLAHSTLGVATHDISDNENGYITTSGMVNGINTSMFSSEGVTLWLDTAGNITETEPTAPIHKVKIGYLIRKHINQGRILISIDTGLDLNDLHDVSIGDYEDGALLVASGAIWQPGANVNDLSTKTEVASISASLVSYSQATSANSLAQAVEYSNLLDANVVHLSGNETISGPKTFNPTTNNIIPLTVKGATGQTADLQQWQDSSGNSLVAVHSEGFSVRTRPGGSDRRIYIRPIAGNETSEMEIAADSVMSLKTPHFYQYYIGGSSYRVDLYNSRFRFKDNLTFGEAAAGVGANVQFEVATQIRSNNAAAIPLYVRGFTGQTANLQEWQNSAGQVLASVASNGAVSISPLGAATTPLTVNMGSARTAIFSLNSSTYADLNLGGGGGALGQLTLHSDGLSTTVNQARIRFTTNTGSDSWLIQRVGQGSPNLNKRLAFQYGTIGGTLLEPLGLYQDGGVQIGGTFSTSPGSGNLAINSNSAALPSLTVKGAAAQTANLQEWQNSSNSILASIASDGNISLIKGVPYSWPSSNSIGTLTNNGSGGLSWQQPSSSFINLDSVPTPTTSGSFGQMGVISGYMYIWAGINTVVRHAVETSW